MAKGRITTLKNSSDEVLYPISLLAAIYKDDNQTTEQWLESVIEDIRSAEKSTIDTLNEALETFQSTSEEKINYYDSMAQTSLDNANAQLAQVISDTQTNANTKVEDLQSEFSQKISDEYQDYSAKVTGDYEYYSEKIKDALDSEHPTQKITREDGIHGFRYYNGFLAYEDDSGTWVNITAGALGGGYGTCDTAASTTTKVCNVDNFVLLSGGLVSIKFTNAVPASAKLNINETGEITIYHKGALIKANVIKAGGIATFVYDGTYYRLVAVDSGTGGGGHVISATEPTDTEMLWIDSENGYILKFYNTSTSAWQTIGSAWG